MTTLSTDLRNKLERTCIAARNLTEMAAKAALEAVAVQHTDAYAHMKRDQKDLRNKLRARGRQLGDMQDAKGNLVIGHLAQECAYEHWHRMLFARFLAENSLLIPPELGTPVTLEECKELAKAEVSSGDVWEYAGRCAQTMLPEIFRADDPVLQVPLAREDQLKLEDLLNDLPADVFTAGDSLGWCYQFWQTERKKKVNESEVPIGADELPAVTQLFTENYMVDFLLDNTLGAWWWGRRSAESKEQRAEPKTEEECRRLIALPGCPWKYLRFVKDDTTGWRPAAGAFDGWPKTAKELKCLDPSCGSGHFVVAMFERLVAMRMAEECLNEKEAVAAVIRDNLFGLEIDPRCTQIAAFNLALAAWRRVGHCGLPAMNLACSGLAPHTAEKDWVALAGDNDKLKAGMVRLYALFKDAPVLGSLINPRAGESDLLVAAFHELQPLLEKALAQKAKDDTAHELAVTARGLAKATEILAGQFTLVATNVPYLGRGKQSDVLMTYCERVHPDAKADLATCFIERCSAFTTTNGVVALVTPQIWLFLGGYKALRVKLLDSLLWLSVVRLGPGAFETISGEVVNAALFLLGRTMPLPESYFTAFDVADIPGANEKAAALLSCNLFKVKQSDQRKNPDSRVTLADFVDTSWLGEFCISTEGLSTGDRDRFIRAFWEKDTVTSDWDFFQGPAETSDDVDGYSDILFWEKGEGVLSRFDGARVQGHAAWTRVGVLVGRMSSIRSSVYGQKLFDKSCVVLTPRDVHNLPAIYVFCCSPEFEGEIRKLDKKIGVATSVPLKVPFDLAYWQKVAATKYPHGLPNPFSNDPTQWLFDGHPKGSDNPLHVAMARLLGYQWPRQTGSSFPDCPALSADGLEKRADTDGIVCIPSVRGEEPAADRLRKLLAAVYGKEWKPTSERDLIHAAGSEADDFDEWLRNDFFDQHCNLFQQRPFLWHIWDGRKRDGFHAIVNYHRLVENSDEGISKGAKGRENESHRGKKLLESLTHSYLGEWITRQKDSEKRGEDGAEERLAAALELKKRLEAILEGNPPVDLFVRWKPLAKQAIGWEPDINDGVRMNIRPFLADDLPNGKKGAGILRAKPKIKWDKDRGKEPARDKKEYPWFWGWDETTQDFMGGREFDGNRGNDCHYTNDVKRKAREALSKEKPENPRGGSK